MSDVILNKAESIQRCVARAREEYAAAAEDFASEYTRQDAALLNITRACEQAIDIANYIVRTEKLGVPKHSRESFDLLAHSAIISREHARTLKSMIGFRNIAVHQYQDIDPAIVREVIDSRLDELVSFSQFMLRRSGSTR